MAQVYDALRTSPQWDRMVFVLNFDENGGFYDHVAPPTVIDDNVNPNPGPAPRLQPAGVPGPGHRYGSVRSEEGRDGRPVRALLDPADDRVALGLEPMTARDANAKNLAEALDFTNKREPITLPPFKPVTSKACPNPTIALA